MSRRKNDFTVPQPLRVRLEAPEKPHLLSWQEAIHRHPQLFRCVFLLAFLLFVGFLIGFLLTLLQTRRGMTVTTLTDDHCAVAAYLDYPHYAAVDGSLHLILTLQNALDCTFSGKVVLTPQESVIGVLPAAEITQTPVWDVTVPPHSIATFNASLSPMHKGGLGWRLMLVDASGAPCPELGKTTVWPRTAYFLTSLTKPGLYLTILGALSTLLGLWPTIRRALNRLRML